MYIYTGINNAPPPSTHHLHVVIITLCLSHVILLQVALGLAKLLQLEASIGLGMLYAACVPGGGAGHLMTVIINGNLSLSLASTLISTLLVTGNVCVSTLYISVYIGPHGDIMLNRLNFKTEYLDLLISLLR